MKLGSRDSRSGRSAWPFLVALSATVVLLAGACGSPVVSAPATAAAPAKAVVPPDTPTGVQHLREHSEWVAPSPGYLNTLAPICGSYGLREDTAGLGT